MIKDNFLFVCASIVVVLVSCFAIIKYRDYSISKQEYSSIVGYVSISSESKTITAKQGKEFIDYCFNELNSKHKVSAVYDAFSEKSFNTICIRRFEYSEDSSETKKYPYFSASLGAFYYDYYYLVPQNLNAYIEIKNYFYIKYKENESQVEMATLPDSFDKNFENTIISNK